MAALPSGVRISEVNFRVESARQPVQNGSAYPGTNWWQPGTKWRRASGYNLAASGYNLAAARYNSYPDMFVQMPSDGISGYPVRVYSLHGFQRTLLNLGLLWWSKRLSKHQNLTHFLLELIVRVLNMPIELKGDNYYSKVFRRVNYKLWNSTFWVVISGCWHQVIVSIYGTHPNGWDANIVVK